jgi:Uma2 family endonuclease
LGEVLFASLPVQLRRGQFREPDIMFMLKRHASRIHDRYWRGADLVMEVVSDDAASRSRDFMKKRSEYAKARIPEYWIVDPRDMRIIVLRLAGTRYAVHGEFGKGMTATSHLLPGLSVDVTAAFAAQEHKGHKPKSRRGK